MPQAQKDAVKRKRRSSRKTGKFVNTEHVRILERDEVPGSGANDSDCDADDDMDNPDTCTDAGERIPVALDAPAGADDDEDEGGDGAAVTLEASVTDVPLLPPREPRTLRSGTTSTALSSCSFLLLLVFMCVELSGLIA